MTKQEILKAFENGETVYFLNESDSPNKKGSCILEINLKNRIIISVSDWCMYSYYADKPTEYEIKTELSKLFKTKAEAEHYLHHANITRTEQLPFLTWEEFLNERGKGGKEIIFKGHNGRGYALVYNKGLNKIDLFDTDGVFWEIVESWKATEENFYKAYDECVRLFRGEE